jgi:hypothetical protein
MLSNNNHDFSVLVQCDNYQVITISFKLHENEICEKMGKFECVYCSYSSIYSPILRTDLLMHIDDLTFVRNR